ncbi:MAG TPA: AraC family transcriptional regulator [Verrucomicrobiota bacterium]|nr:AraC family transcriptional regulator [Verrucomicrobiota bacterium]
MPQSSAQLAKSGARSSRRSSALPFSEAEAWSAIGNGWRQLHGSFRQIGVSFEWHDFECAETFDWARSFHPDSIEVCLNMAGNGRIVHQKQSAEFAPLTAGFYRQGRSPLTAVRNGDERHQFITVEFSPAFLKKHLAGQSELHPLVKSTIENGGGSSGVGPSVRLSTELQQLAVSLRHPPALASAQNLWYHSKALELAVAFFFSQPEEKELFCVRHKRLAQERVARAIAILQKNLVEPPTLEEIGREVGCSPFHLSRTFSAETGMTMPQYLRQLRMEKAAQLLQSGKHNVTEAALEVGYNSLSHFSQAFHETFGCCPGLYPFATPTQKAVKT